MGAFHTAAGVNCALGYVQGAQGVCVQPVRLNALQAMHGYDGTG